METIKTFEDACKALGIEPTLPDFSHSPIKYQKALTAHYKLVIIAEAFNEGWKPDWQNIDQEKWQITRAIYDFHRSSRKLIVINLKYISSNICFKTLEDGEFFLKTQKSLCKDYFLFDK